MANTYLAKYHSFNPKTVQDLLISPYTVGCTLAGVNGTILYHDGTQWIVIKNSFPFRGILYTSSEQEAVDTFWRFESNEQTKNREYK